MSLGSSGVGGSSSEAFGGKDEALGGGSPPRLAELFEEASRCIAVVGNGDGGQYFGSQRIRPLARKIYSCSDPRGYGSERELTCCVNGSVRELRSCSNPCGHDSARALDFCVKGSLRELHSCSNPRGYGLAQALKFCVNGSLNSCIRRRGGVRLRSAAVHVVLQV